MNRKIEFKRVYNIWKVMRQRCNNPNNPKYPRYGGRGITICKEWDDFIAFKDWAYANGYREDLMIDRINNNGNYEPNNCRWTNNTVQSNNRSNNSHITVLGETHTIAEWVRISGIPLATINWRRLTAQWPDEDVLKEYVAKKKEVV